VIQLIQGETRQSFDPENPDDALQLASRIASRSTAIWLHACDLSRETMNALGGCLGLHPLTIADCLNPHQRPKIERHPDYLYLVIYELLPFEPGTSLQAREINIIAGDHFVLTVTRQQSCLLAQLIEMPYPHGDHDSTISTLLYRVLDAAVDTYFPTLDVYSDAMESLENRIFVAFDPQVLSHIFMIKKDLLTLRRLVTPLRDVLLYMVRRDDPLFGDRHYVYFQDVLDHLLRISDTIDITRDFISNTLDAYQSVVSNRTNDTMKKLTVISTILGSMTLVAGIYGMNFRTIPELNWSHGYAWALTLMVGSSVGLLLLFRWRRYI